LKPTGEKSGPNQGEREREQGFASACPQPKKKRGKKGTRFWLSSPQNKKSVGKGKGNKVLVWFACFSGKCFKSCFGFNAVMGYGKVLGLAFLLSVALAGCLGPAGPMPSQEAEKDPAGFFCKAVQKEAVALDGTYLVTDVVGESRSSVQLNVENNEAADSERGPLFKALFGSGSKERFEALCLPETGGIRTGKTLVEYLGAEGFGSGESDCFSLAYPAIGMVPASQEKVCFDRLGFYISFSEAEQAGKKIMQMVEFSP
jgi:hypothetical protein